MDQEELEQQAFIHTLRHIAGVSEEFAEQAWYSIKAAPTMSPEKQAKIYANLYGLKKEVKR